MSDHSRSYPDNAALRQDDPTCYIERSKVREILIGQPDESLYITEEILREVDALPIMTVEGSGVRAQPPFKLGDIVRMRDGAPFSIEWRGITMKVVSLRVDPQGTYWVSVIDETEGYSPHHRGNGVYDGETTDIDADHLCAVSSTEGK